MRYPAFLGLSAVTAAAVLMAGILIVTDHRPSPVAGGGELFFPDLATTANTVESIHIQKGDHTVTLAATDQGWVLKERGDYPVSLEKIKQLVISLARTRKIEAKTDRADRYARIGVEDVAPDGGATEVTLADAQGKPVAQLLIGNAALAGEVSDGTFVRIPGEQRAWLAAGIFNVGAEPVDWVDPVLIDLPASDLAEVKVRRPDGGTITAVKTDAEAPHFTLRDVPHGQRLKREDAADGMGLVLTQLQLQDLAMADQVAFPAEDTFHVQFHTFDGLIVDADLVERDGKEWVRLTPSTAPGASEETLAKVSALKARLNGYAFAVPSWKVASLKRPLPELIEPASGS